MLDDQLAGVHKHERQIKELKEQSMVATYKSDSEEVTLSPQEVGYKSSFSNIWSPLSVSVYI